MHKTDDLATRGGNLFFILQCGRVPLTVVPQCTEAKDRKTSSIYGMTMHSPCLFKMKQWQIHFSCLKLNFSVFVFKLF